MLNFKSKALFAALLACGVTSALAGAGVVNTSVSSLQDAVTYSTTGSTVKPVKPALTTYVGYKVDISSDAANTNTINNIYFEASTSVTDGAELATFSSAEGATCTPTNATETAVRCVIGQLTAGAAYPTVVLFFKAPVKVVNDVADGETEDRVVLTGTTYYAEGTGGPNSPPDNSVNGWLPAGYPVTLGTASATLVKSGVPKAGGTFFTGDGSSTSSDPFTTSVSVPPAAAYTKALIFEEPLATNCTNFVACWTSEITIDGTFSPYLTIVLRQDASNIKPGIKIGSTVIWYTGADNNTVQVGDCSNATTPRTDGLPCVAGRKHYKNKTVDGWTPDLDGDFEWTLINTKNGRLAID